MATNCRINNRTPLEFNLITKPGNDSPWEPGSYKVLETSVGPWSETTFLALNRDEGIREGKVYTMRTRVKTPKSLDIMYLEEKLVGLAVNSNIWAQVESADGQRPETGWIPEGKKTIAFASRGQSYKVILRWEGTDWNDDLEYSIELDPNANDAEEA